MNLIHRRSLRWVAPVILGALLAGCGTPDGIPATSQPGVSGTPEAQTPGATQDAATQAATEPGFSGSGPWQVTFTAEDDVELSGTLYGDGTTAIVLAPNYPGGPEGWAAFAKAAADAGYRALSFDFRGYGSSKGSQNPADLPKDIRAAMSYLQEQGSQRIVVVGAGLGGSAAILTAAKEPSAISGVVLISTPRGVEGLQVADADLAALKIPSLWLAARNDLTQNVEEMSGLAGSSQKAMWIYEGSSLHGTYIFDGADGADLQRRLLEFVAEVTA